MLRYNPSHLCVSVRDGINEVHRASQCGAQHAIVVAEQSHQHLAWCSGVSVGAMLISGCGGKPPTTSRKCG